jgi:purine-binding chemotaxis protein CheW
VSSDASESCLLVRAARQLYALPLAHVEETMRPLPVRPLAGLPPFILGVTVIRGAPVPVIDAAAVSGHGRPSPGVGRFVTLKLAERRAAFAVDEVLGLRRIDRGRLFELPRLLATTTDDVGLAIGTLDSELLMVLGSGRLVPDEVWDAIEAGDLP